MERYARIVSRSSTFSKEQIVNVPVSEILKIESGDSITVEGELIVSCTKDTFHTWEEITFHTY
jgi:hypothetical protein